MSNAKEEVRMFLELIPDDGISIGKAAYSYLKQRGLDEKFIDEVSKVISLPEEKKLKVLYNGQKNRKRD